MDRASVEEPVASAAGRRCISIEAGGALYGLAVEEVQEVMAMQPLARVFHAPPELSGVMSLRGDVLPVIELAVVLGGPAAPVAGEAHIVVVREEAGARRRAGLRVTRLCGLRDVPASGLEPVPSTIAARAREYVTGVVSESPAFVVLRVSAILDAPALLSLRASWS